MIGIEVDTKDLRDKLANFDQYVVETALMSATKEIAQALHEALVKNTPVVTGNLRKMWSAGDNLFFEVKKVDDGFEVTLTNAAQNEQGYKYANVVNYGHSRPNGEWVMGRFFVEASIVQTDPQVRQIIDKNLRKYLKRWSNG